MKKRSASKRALVGAFFFSTCLWINSPAQEDELVASHPVIVTQNVSLRHEVEEAIAKGKRYLVSIQKEEGYWGAKDHPGISGLVLTALQGEPSRPPQTSSYLVKGYDFLNHCIRKDGSVHGGKGSEIYNTSLSLIAMMANLPRFREEARKARRFLIISQIGPEQGDTNNSGNVGGYSDGNNALYPESIITLHALEALYYSKSLVRNDRGETDRHLNLPAVMDFLQNHRTLLAINKQPEISDNSSKTDSSSVPSFSSSSVATNLPEGKVNLAVMHLNAGITLLSYFYLELPKNDTRYGALIPYLEKNSLLDSNPVRQDVLCFYLQVMVKALTLTGLNEVQTAKGGNVNWREALALRLMDLQQANGAWNSNKMDVVESDQSVAIAYGLIALEIIHREL